MKEKNLRKKTVIVAVALSVLMFCVSCATTQPIGLADIRAEKCQAEIGTYCNDVTPGQERMLACLYAHGEKLSEPCKYSLYEASVQLKRAVHEQANTCVSSSLTR